MSKLLVTSRSYPPVITGSSIIMYNLLTAYPGQFVSVCSSLYEAKKDPSFQIHAPRLQLSFKNDLLQRVFERFQSKLLPFLKFRIKRFAKKHGCTHIFAVYPNGPLLVASYEVARDLGLPYYVHMHDLWEENLRKGHPNRRLAEKYEQQILEGAECVFCMTEVQEEHLNKKYSIRTEILPHTVTQDALDQFPSGSELGSNQTKKVIYTGNISHLMNLDAFKQLVQAIDLLPDDYEFHIYTSWDEKVMKQYDIYHPRMKLGWAQKSEMNSILNSGDVLFLPLSFQNASMHEVNTVYATKTLDYLTSGTPILAYSPPTSYHSQHAMEHGWAHVVDRSEPKALAEAIETLCNNAEVASQVVNQARVEAERRSASKHASRLHQLIESKPTINTKN